VQAGVKLRIQNRPINKQTEGIYFDIMAGLEEVGMKKKGTRIALFLGAIPFITMVFLLPFVNRIEPIILGLPFLLFWLLAWVVLTPGILALAYKLEKKYNPPEDGEDE
jgi:Na+/melibiose symporter-like transporter